MTRNRLAEIAEAAIAAAVEAEYPSQRPVTVELAQVEPQQVEWLWSGWIPQGRLSLLIGHAGQGKSWLTLAIAAAVSRGWPLPGDDRPRTPRRVLLIGAEDGLADTVRPRLDALGADVSQIVALEGVTTERGERGFLLADVGPLEQVLVGGGFRLVVIDPLTAFAGRADSFKDAEVRGLLAPLAQLAERHACAIVGVMHFRKGQADTALQRASGSIAWGAAARSVFAVGTDPQAQDGTSERHVLPIKHNLCPAPEGITFSLEAGRFAWGGRSHLSAGQLMAAPTGGDDDGALAEARDWLAELLADGPVAAREVEQAARAAALSWASVRRAKSALGVRSRKAGMDSGWSWSLPESTPEDAQTATPAEISSPKVLKHETLSSFGDVEHLQETGPPLEALAEAAPDLDEAIDLLPLEALAADPEEAEVEL